MNDIARLPERPEAPSADVRALCDELRDLYDEIADLLDRDRIEALPPARLALPGRGTLSIPLYLGHTLRHWP